MTHRLFRNALLSAAVAAMAACSAASAADLTKSADIVNALASVPKAVQSADGRWLRRDPSIDLQVQFDFDRSKLTPLGAQQLDELASAFKQPALAGFAFELAGHTDKVGTPAHNLKLSSERAEAARDYLARQHGIAPERMVARGYGADQLADPAHPDAAVNRRVEVRRLAAAPAIVPPPPPPTPAAAPVRPLPAPQPLPPSGGAIINRQ